MLEQLLRKLFVRVAGFKLPPGRITVAQLFRQFRIHRRRRRISTIGRPVFAAVAAGAIALSGGLPPGILGKSSPRAGHHITFVRGAFNPSYLSVRFGWLQKGYVVTGGDTSPAEEDLSAGNKKLNLEWDLSAYARNVCHEMTAEEQFACSKLVWGLQGPLTITGSGPVIDGRASLWLSYGVSATSITLAFEYAPNAWALLAQPSSLKGKAAAVRIARGVKFGRHVAFRFASRFTSLPAGWLIPAVDFGAGDGVYLAYAYKIVKLRTISPATPLNMSNDTNPNVPFIDIEPTFNGSHGCQHAKPPYVTIHGYRYSFSNVKVTKHRYSQTLNCGNAGGLWVFVNEIGAGVHPHYALSPTQILQRMHLLGARPSHWVKNPLP